jgi:type V secretory pathway adhesin AidA
VERYDQQAASYRTCLDGVVRDTSLAENARREAVQASNASAAQVETLWEAYGAATDRYRSHQAEQARLAAEQAQANRPPAP